MSSTYRPICLSHDPAIVVYGEDHEDLYWTDRDTALGALARRKGDLAAHKACDLVLGAYSYPLVKIGCPANSHRTPGTRVGAPCWHNNDQWIDVGWLRLLVAALAEPTPSTTAVLAPRQIDPCWVPDRVNRLRNLFNPEEDE